MTVGKQFEKNFAMICFLLSPSGGKRKTHFSLQNSERPFCLPTVTHSPPVSAIMALNIMYRQKKTDGNRPRLPSVSVAFLCILHNPLFMIRVVGLCNMLKLTIFQRKSQNIIDIYKVFGWGRFHRKCAARNRIAMTTKAAINTAGSLPILRYSQTQQIPPTREAQA